MKVYDCIPSFVSGCRTYADGKLGGGIYVVEGDWDLVGTYYSSYDYQ